jgi:hypothetical protein
MSQSPGVQTVVVTGVDSQKRPVETRFTVNSRPLDDPKLPQNFFPEAQYQLDFSSNGVPNPEISVDIFVNGELYAKDRPASINFIPPSTARTVRFVRSVGNREFDKFGVEVLPLPVPEISKPVFKKGDDIATVQTTSYGIYKGRPNTAELKVAEGNAEDPELVSTQELSGFTHVQTWRIRRHDPDRSFSFSLNAIDQRGSGSGKSRTVEYDDLGH